MYGTPIYNTVKEKVTLVYTEVERKALLSRPLNNVWEPQPSFNPLGKPLV